MAPRPHGHAVAGQRPAEIDRAIQLLAGLGPGAGRAGRQLRGRAAAARGAVLVDRSQALSQFLSALSVSRPAGGVRLAARGGWPLPDADARQARQVRELERHTQQVSAESSYVRQAFVWDKLNYESLEKYDDSIAPLRRYFADEVIGHCATSICRRPAPHPLAGRDRPVDALSKSCSTLCRGSSPMAC